MWAAAAAAARRRTKERQEAARAAGMNSAQNQSAFHAMIHNDEVHAHATIYEINSGVYTVVATNYNANRSASVQPYTEAKKATAATGNRARPCMRINVVVAMQRNEQLGRSWRGSEEGG